jgi:hypothetical protein
MINMKAIFIRLIVFTALCIACALLFSCASAPFKHQPVQVFDANTVTVVCNCDTFCPVIEHSEIKLGTTVGQNTTIQADSVRTIHINHVETVNIGQ